MYNHDAQGTRANPHESLLTPESVRGLHVAWRYEAPGPVYGTPAVVGESVYAADMLGDVFALSAASGANVIIGDQNGTVHAFDRATGALRWSVRPNTAAYSAIWGSATEITARDADGKSRRLVIVPFSSNEETFTPTTAQPCCFARGSVAALDPASGRLVWQAWTITQADVARGAAGATV